MHQTDGAKVHETSPSSASATGGLTGNIQGNANKDRQRAAEVSRGLEVDGVKAESNRKYKE